jgi:ABC-2 type transport system permease protein
VSPRLFLSIATMEARKLMSYRADFWIAAVFSFAIQLAVLYFLVRALFAESGAGLVGGMTFEEMFGYYLLLVLLRGVIRGVEMRIEGSVSDEIYQGHLNRYLVYPTTYFPFKYAQHLGMMGPAVAQSVLFAVACALVLDLPASIAPTPSRIAMGLGAIAVANLLNFTIALPAECVAFWQDQVWSLNVMVRFAIMFLGGAMIPLSMFPEWSQAALQALPFGYVFAFPIDCLMGRVTWGEWAVGMAAGLLWCGVLALATRAIWRRGARAYTGVGI